MKRLALLIFLLSASPALAADVLLGKYGQAKTVSFCLYTTTGAALKTDAAHASGDTVITKDEGSPANTTNGFVDEGNCYSLALTATEMQAGRIVLTIVDQTSPVWLDKVITIETYGNASGEHAFDLDTASVSVGSGGITSSSFGSGAIDATAIAADAIGASELATDSIGAAEIAASAIGLSELAADGTAQAGGAATITIASAETYGDNTLAGRTICITGGTGKGQCEMIASNVSSTDVVTVNRNWPVAAPDNTSTYVVGDRNQVGGFDSASITAAAIASDAIGAAELASDSIGAAEVADGAIDAGALGSDAITAAKVADGAIDAGALASNSITAAKVADGAIDAATFSSGAIDATAIAADAIAASELAAGALAEINAEVVDVMATDTHTELTSCPAATASYNTMLRYMFMMMRNEIDTTSTQQIVRRDDASTALCTFAVSDDSTTFTRGEGS